MMFPVVITWGNYITLSYRLENVICILLHYLQSLYYLGAGDCEYRTFQSERSPCRERPALVQPADQNQGHCWSLTGSQIQTAVTPGGN